MTLTTLLNSTLLEFFVDEEFQIEETFGKCCRIDLYEKVLYIDEYQCKEFVHMFDLPLVQVVNLIICHELGHYLLYQNGENHHDEEAATKLGIEFLNNIYTFEDNVFKVTEYCLESYTLMYGSYENYRKAIEKKWQKTI